MFSFCNILFITINICMNFFYMKYMLIILVGNMNFFYHSYEFLIIVYTFELICECQLIYIHFDTWYIVANIRNFLFENRKFYCCAEINFPKFISGVLEITLYFLDIYRLKTDFLSTNIQKNIRYCLIHLIFPYLNLSTISIQKKNEDINSLFLIFQIQLENCFFTITMLSENIRYTIFGMKC